jgi:protein-tyrosine phosphatase
MSGSILAVCTANICRSPMIEAALRRSLVTPSDLLVASAGSKGTDGRDADPVTVQVAMEFGLDLHAHHARPLRAEFVESADLIVVAELEHLLAVIDGRPKAFAKTFLLLELAERATPRRPEEDLAEWVARHHQGRSPAALMKSAGSLGLSDPYKQGADKIRRTAQQIVGATDTLALAWNSAGQ